MARTPANGDMWCTDDCASVAQWNPPGGNRMGEAWVDALWDAAEAGLHPVDVPDGPHLWMLVRPGSVRTGPGRG